MDAVKKIECFYDFITIKQLNTGVLLQIVYL